MIWIYRKKKRLADCYLIWVWRKFDILVTVCYTSNIMKTLMIQKHYVPCLMLSATWRKLAGEGVF